MGTKISRIDSARKTVDELLDEMELGDAPVERYIMKAKRIARLLRDTEAERWLDLEHRGYPKNFSFSSIATCKQYAISGGRLTGGNYITTSLPALEARFEVDKVTLGAVRTDPSSSIAKDYLAAGASARLFADQLLMVNQLKREHEKNAGLLSSLKGSIYTYATNIYISLEFGDAAQSIFESARITVDDFIGKTSPDAAAKLVAINERMQEGDAESYSAALTSCRRLLMSIANTIFPPSKTTYKDSSGNNRKVGEEQYKNRILAFIDQNIQSNSTSSIVVSEIEHLASRLDAVYEKACKGVHVEVSAAEAELAVIHTYLLIAEIARYWIDPASNTVA